MHGTHVGEPLILSLSYNHAELKSYTEYCLEREGVSLCGVTAPYTAAYYTSKGCSEPVPYSSLHTAGDILQQ